MESLKTAQFAGSLTVGKGGLLLKKTPVTQLTSTTTAVTLTDKAGVITCFTSVLAAQGKAVFTVTAPVNTDSVVLCSIASYSGTTGLPSASITTLANGSFVVTISNAHATEALDGVIRLSVLIV